MRRSPLTLTMALFITTLTFSPATAKAELASMKTKSLTTIAEVAKNAGQHSTVNHQSKTGKAWLSRQTKSSTTTIAEVTKNAAQGSPSHVCETPTKQYKSNLSKVDKPIAESSRATKRTKPVSSRLIDWRKFWQQ